MAVPRSTLIRGEFYILYPDLPHNGPEPDGDTINFLPDNDDLVPALPRFSGVRPDRKHLGTYGVRFDDSQQGPVPADPGQQGGIARRGRGELAIAHLSADGGQDRDVMGSAVGVHAGHHLHLGRDSDSDGLVGHAGHCATSSARTGTGQRRGRAKRTGQ